MARRGLGTAAVLGEAARMADAEGLGAVTLARVAAALGVRAPSLYNHVTGREGLVAGLALGAIRDLTAALRDAAVGRSGPEALLAAAHAYRDYARAHPGRYEAMQRAPATGDEERRVASGEALEVLARILRGWGLEGVDALHAIRGLRSALHGFVDLERVGGFGLDADLDESFDRLVRGFAAGLAPRRP